MLTLQVNRQVAQCNCAKRFQVEQISANRYRVSAGSTVAPVHSLRHARCCSSHAAWCLPREGARPHVLRASWRCGLQHRDGRDPTAW